MLPSHSLVACLEGTTLTLFFALIAKLFGTAVLFMWLPICLFILDEWFRALWRVWQLPRAEAAQTFMWWA